MDNELYIAALSMLMMDPDIFCTMEKGNEANVRNKKNYIEWLENYLIPVNKIYTGAGVDFATEIYVLRCAILHNGYNSLEFQRSQKDIHRFNIKTSFENRRTHTSGEYRH